MTVTVQVEPWLTRTGLEHDTVVVVGLVVTPDAIVKAMTTVWTAAPLVPVKLRWKLPTGEEVVAEIEQTVELVLGLGPGNFRLLSVHETVTDPAGAKDVELFVSVTVPAKWFRPVNVIVVVPGVPP